MMRRMRITWKTMRKMNGGMTEDLARCVMNVFQLDILTDGQVN